MAQQAETTVIPKLDQLPDRHMIRDPADARNESVELVVILSSLVPAMKNANWFLEAFFIVYGLATFR